jgi:CDP-glycerol glycerophosphotransferase
VSPNAFSTPILRRAFRYDGPIVESGYPRNDFLASPRAAAAARHAVRASLGLDDATRAILYAPTLRDGAPFELRLDVAALNKALGGDHVVLLRAHPVVVATMSEADRRDAVDVSRHGDIRDLYLAADVLVTDYSSAMFDFAVTRKPMLFFTYDLARYRDALRGFYFDFEQDAPGPLIETTEQLVDALSELERVRERFTPAYERFVARFCHLDDGHAAERVVDAVFGERSPVR